MLIGWGQHDITPRSGKTLVAGQIPFRPTDVVHDPIYATAMVIQDKNVRVIWVSCDMCHLTRKITEDTAALLQDCLPDFNTDQLIISATHATACTYIDSSPFQGAGHEIDYSQIEPLDATRASVCRGIVHTVMEAVSSLEECTVSYASADILTGFCRRVVYTDGSAVMYGDVHREDFLRMEYPDGGPSQFLYFHRCSDGALRGILANVPCPAQADEGNAYITADYWGVVRDRLQAEYGPDVRLLSLCRAAGELAPYNLLTPGKHSDMKGRKTVERLGNHIADAMIRKESCPDMTAPSDIPLRHLRKNVQFPPRQTDEATYRQALAYFANPDNFDETGHSKNWTEHFLYSHIRKLWEQKPGAFPAAVSAVMLGDFLFFTAPAELFAEYAHRIRMRFPGHPVFDVQLTNDSIGYLPTSEAIARGGYSALIFSNLTDGAGGNHYVHCVTEMLRELIK